MVAVISPGNISGTVVATASKSAMQRACALSLLNNGRTIIHNPGNSNDDLAALAIIRALGAQYQLENECLIITSTGHVTGSGMIDCRESGLSFRMFAAVAALSNNEIILTGSGSLLTRPMQFFDDIFPLLGIHVQTNNGFLPVKIRGPLLPAAITIDGSQSSQYLTGLLFAFAKAATIPVVIAVHDLKSKPYIDLSLQMLEYFGYRIRHEQYSKFFIEPSAATEKEITYYTEGDWSGAAFLLVAGAIAGNVRVQGLDLYSTQADRAIMDVLVAAAANVQVEGSCVLVNNEGVLKPIQFNATDCPDLFPPLATLAAYCKGISVIKGISRLDGKESNRAETLKDVFGKMGIDIKLQDDNMIITGGTGIHAAELSSHHDHRIAMACAIAALKADGDIKIIHAESVNKSYPGFYDHLQKLGATVSFM